MLAQQGGRARAAVRPEGGSLHLLDWPTSSILAGVSPALCPAPRSRCGTPFPSGVPRIPPPQVHAALREPRPCQPGLGLPGHSGGFRETLEAPPGFELLPGTGGCSDRDPRSAGAGLQWRGGPRACPRVPSLSALPSCTARIPGPAAPEAAGGAGEGENGSDPPPSPCPPTRRPPHEPSAAWRLRAAPPGCPPPRLCVPPARCTTTGSPSPSIPVLCWRCFNKLCAVATGRVTRLCPPRDPKKWLRHPPPQSSSGEEGMGRGRGQGGPRQL